MNEMTFTMSFRVYLAVAGLGVVLNIVIASVTSPRSQKML